MSSPNLALIVVLHRVATDPVLCRGRIKGFAHATGRSPSTLAHKFNPHDASNLNLPELLDFLAYVTPDGRRIVLDALHGTLGDSFAVFVSPAKPPELLASLGDLLHGVADLALHAGLPMRRIGRRDLARTPQATAARMMRAMLDVWRVVCTGMPALPELQGGRADG